MTNRLKIILLLILISVTAWVLIPKIGAWYFSSQKECVQNKYRLVSFGVFDDGQENLVLRINVEYYCDSTYWNYYNESIQPGVDGTNDSIIFIGNESDSSYHLGLDVKDFVNKFNKEELVRMGINKFSSEINKELFSNENETIMVILDKKLNLIDTLYSKKSRVPVGASEE